MSAPSDAVQRLLSRLKRVKRCGEGWTSLCPSHEDHESSLSIGIGEDGRILLKCFAGCPADSIVRAVGLTMADLFNEGELGAKRPVTLLDLSRDKRLPEEFLRSIGLRDRNDGVVIEYRLADGRPAPRQRLRTALRAKDGSLWLFGKGKPVTYGLDRGEETRRAGYLVLVEGESDCWTLWHHGFPALGTPGAGMAGKLQLEDLGSTDKIFVVQEPGQGGQTFVDGIARQLAKVGWKGTARVVRLEGCKDPNDLHRRNPDDFKSAFRTALAEAEILPKAEPNDAGNPPEDIEGILAESELLGLSEHPSPTSIDRALRRLASLTTSCDPLQRQLIRHVAVEQLRLLGLHAPARIVDAALAVDDPVGSKEEKGLLLVQPKLWDEAVAASDVLNQFVEVLQRYVVFGRYAAEAVALWILHAYCLDYITISPILAINSPLKRCGKSTLLDVVSSLVPRLLLASSITAAALFRAVDKHRPTLLIDEADTFIAKSDELRGIINAGHTKTTAQVVRTVGDDHEPRIFSTWCAKGIALIGRLSSTLEDRSILVSLRRKRPGEKVARLRRDRFFEAHEELRQKAARWASDHGSSLRDADPLPVEGLHDRALDNWQTLFAIADLAGGDWPERARRAASALSGAIDEGGSSAAVQLLADVRDVFEERGASELFTETLLTALLDREERPWKEWRKGRALSASQLANLLKPFGVGPRQFRQDGTKGRGYVLTDFEDAFARYLPSCPGQPGQTTDSGLFREESVPVRPEPVPGQPGTPPTSSAQCPGSEPGRPGACPTPEAAEVPIVPAVPARSPRPDTGSLDPDTEEFEEFEV